MTVQDARYFYLSAANVARSHDDWCPLYCQRWDCAFTAVHWARVDAMSVAYDMAVAEASRARVGTVER